MRLYMSTACDILFHAGIFCMSTHIPHHFLPFRGHKGSGVRKVSRKTLKAVAHLSQSDAADQV